ncbi:hypothetical protein GBZ48_10475 [Azospirillum melinis]|uniref:Uncharacterized protein n=1 Tax=Azospirillum melinis TaxID=328839 RepID=A0ABX2K935_9PROT|nr:hypothetical protein [Azospirillum melinis]MBP2304751.1 hypothetical protein [Azospirillum melinis]NUA99718.1 hypothetical protein [Azospirillum melinis]
MIGCTDNPAEAFSVQPINPIGFAVHDFQVISPSGERFPSPVGKHTFFAASISYVAFLFCYPSDPKAGYRLLTPSILALPSNQ